MPRLAMKSFTQEKIDALILCVLGAFVTIGMLAVCGAEIIGHFHNNSGEPIAWGAMIVVVTFDLVCAGLGLVLYRRACRKEEMIGHCPKCGDYLKGTQDSRPESIVPPW
jgi:hypothetical protein